MLHQLKFCIADYLTIIETYYFVQAFNFKHTKKYFQKRIFNNLKKMLGNKYPLVVDILKSLNGILTGSIMIQAIHDVKWPESDIDIFISKYPITKQDMNNEGYTDQYYDSNDDNYDNYEDYETEKSKYIIKIKKKLTNMKELDKFVAFKYNLKKEFFSSNTYDGSPIAIDERSSITYENLENNIKIQITTVTTSRDSLALYIFDNFDFDFCKCYMELFDNDNSYNIDYYDLYSIIHKTAIVNPLMMLHKYKNIKDGLVKMHNRHYKYTNRKFIIKYTETIGDEYLQKGGLKDETVIGYEAYKDKNNCKKNCFFAKIGVNHCHFGCYILFLNK